MAVCTPHPGSGCWTDLLWIPCQRELEDLNQWSSCKTWKPPPSSRWSLVDKCSWKGPGPYLCGCWNFVTDPLVSVSNKGPYARCPLRQWKEVELSSGAEEVWSLTKEWRGGSSCFKVHVLSKSPLVEPLYRVLISGEGRGMEFLLVIAPDCIAPGPASLHRSCRHHRELSCAVFMHIAPELKCEVQPLPTRNSGLKCWVQGLHTWCPMTK